MTQMQADPQALMDLANRLRSDPIPTMRRAKLSLAPCSLGDHTFGFIGTRLVQGGYDNAWQTSQQTIGDAADAMDSGALGLANVAKLYYEAETYNTFTDSLKPEPNPIDISQALPEDGVSGNFWPGLGAYTLCIPLFPIYAAVHGSLDAAAGFAPVLIAATVLFGLTEPDDAQINTITNNWLSASNDVYASHLEWKTLIGTIDNAWPSGDGARPQFDSWQGKLDADLSSLEGGIKQVYSIIQDTANDVHEINQYLFYEVIAVTASLVALTAADIFFGAGEAAKNVIAAALLAAVVGTIATMSAILVRMVVSIGNAIGNRIAFSHAAGSDQQPDFTQLPTADWSDAAPPPGIGPQFAPTSPAPAGGGGTPSPNIH